MRIQKDAALLHSKSEVHAFSSTSIKSCPWGPAVLKLFVVIPVPFRKILTYYIRPKEIHDIFRFTVIKHSAIRYSTVALDTLS